MGEEDKRVDTSFYSPPPAFFSVFWFFRFTRPILGWPRLRLFSLSAVTGSNPRSRQRHFTHNQILFSTVTICRLYYYSLSQPSLFGCPSQAPQRMDHDLLRRFGLEDVILLSQRRVTLDERRTRFSFVNVFFGFKWLDSFMLRKKTVLRLRTS